MPYSHQYVRRRKNYLDVYGHCQAVRKDFITTN